MDGQDGQDWKPRTTKDTKSTNLERDEDKQDKKLTGEIRVRTPPNSQRPPPSRCSRPASTMNDSAWPSATEKLV